MSGLEDVGLFDIASVIADEIHSLILETDLDRSGRFNDRCNDANWQEPSIEHDKVHYENFKKLYPNEVDYLITILNPKRRVNYE